jgi:hypothetical protein
MEKKDIIGWAGTAIFAVAVDRFWTSIFGSTPAWLALCVLGLITIGLVIWVTITLRDAIPNLLAALKDKTKDWKKPATQVGGAIAVSLVVLLWPARVGWQMTHAWRAWGRLSFPSVAVTADPSRITTTETTQLAVSLGDKPASDVSCAWKIDKELRNPDCKIPYRPPAGYSGNAMIEVTVTHDGWELGRARYQLAVAYQGVMEISPRVSRGFVDDTLHWTVTLDSRTVPQQDSCQWTIGQEVLSSAVPCSAEHAIKESELGGSHTVKVAVIDPKGTTIASGEAQYSVSPIPAVYFEYVVEASGRTSKPASANHTLPQAITDTMITNLQSIVSGNVGIELVGDASGESAQPPVAPCRNFHELWPLQPLDPDRSGLIKALQSIETGHSDTVPLNEAVKRGFLALAPNASSSADAVLVILAVGPDTCPGGGNLEKILNDLRMANPTLHVRSLLYDYRLLTLTVAVAFTETDREEWRERTSLFRLGDAPTVVLLANNEEQLRDIQTAIVGLSASRHSDRLGACERLISIASSPDKQKLQNYCRVHIR